MKPLGSRRRSMESAPASEPVVPILFSMAQRQKEGYSVGSSVYSPYVHSTLVAKSTVQQREQDIAACIDVLVAHIEREGISIQDYFFRHGATLPKVLGEHYRTLNQYADKFPLWFKDVLELVATRFALSEVLTRFLDEMTDQELYDSSVEHHKDVMLLLLSDPELARNDRERYNKRLEMEGQEVMADTTTFEDVFLHLNASLQERSAVYYGARDLAVPAVVIQEHDVDVQLPPRIRDRIAAYEVQRVEALQQEVNARKEAVLMDFETVFKEIVDSLCDPRNTLSVGEVLGVYLGMYPEEVRGQFLELLRTRVASTDIPVGMTRLRYVQLRTAVAVYSV